MLPPIGCCPGWREFDSNAGLCELTGGRGPCLTDDLAAVACAHGFARVGGQCLRAFSGALSHAAAQEHCHSKWGAELLSVRDAVTDAAALREEVASR